MKVWKNEYEAEAAIHALENAKRNLSEEEFEKLKQEFIQVALKSYTSAKQKFFELLTF